MNDERPESIQLAAALMAGRVGDMVNWPRPAGDVELEIIAIAYGASDESDDHA